MPTSLTLTEGLPNGKGQQVLRELQSRGIDVGDYCAISTDEALAKDIAAVFFKHRLFTKPEAQIKRLLWLNENVWKSPLITKDLLRELGEPPVCPSSNADSLFCICLFFEFGNALTTFSRNWDACEFVFGTETTRKQVRMRFCEVGVRFRKKAIPRPVGLRWQIVELGRKYCGQTPESVRAELDRSKVMGIGQELPLIAAMHPKWAQYMHDCSRAEIGRLPGIIATDLVISDTSGKFNDVPILRNGQFLELWSMPVNETYDRMGCGSLL